MAAEGVTAAAVTSYTESKYPILSRYHVGQHPLAKEAALKRLEPLPETRAAFTKALTREMTADGAETLDPHTVKKYQDKMVLEGLGKNVDLMYAREFQRWIRGVSVFNEPSLTPWGHRNMFHVPGVVEYLRELVQMRFDYQQSLMHLYMQPPQTLLDLELYYKYIVLQFGLVIPRNDGRVPNTGMPLAGDPRSFMSVSGMLSFLDDYQLTSFRDRDLPLTDQNKINLQDRNPNASLVGDFGSDIDTLKTVHQGLGPENPMSNGQPSSGGQNAPTTPPPDVLSKLVFRQQKEMAELAREITRIECERYLREGEAQRALADMEAKHRAEMDAINQRFTTQVSAPSTGSSTSTADEAAEIRRQYEREKAAEEKRHADEKKRRDDEDQRDRDAAAQKLAKAKTKLTTAKQLNDRLSKENAEELAKRAEENKALARDLKAAQVAEENARLATASETKRMSEEYDRQLAEKLAEARKAFSGSSSQWASVAGKRQAERDTAAAQVKAWQEEANKYATESAAHKAALDGLNAANARLGEELQILQASAATHEEAIKTAAALARASTVAEGEKLLQAQADQYTATVEKMREDFKGSTEEWQAIVENLTKEKIESDAKVTQYSQEAQAARQDAEAQRVLAAKLANDAQTRATMLKQLKKQVKNAGNRALAAALTARDNAVTRQQLEAELDAKVAEAVANKEAEAAETINRVMREQQAKRMASVAYYKGLYSQVAAESTVKTQALADLQATVAELRGQLEAVDNTPGVALGTMVVSPAVAYAQQAASDTSESAHTAMVINTMHQYALQAAASHGQTVSEEEVTLEHAEYWNDLVMTREHHNAAGFAKARAIATSVGLKTLHQVSEWRRMNPTAEISENTRNQALDAYIAMYNAPPDMLTEDERVHYYETTRVMLREMVQKLYNLSPLIDPTTSLYGVTDTDKDVVKIQNGLAMTVAEGAISNYTNAKFDEVGMYGLFKGLSDMVSGLKHKFGTAIQDAYSDEQRRVGAASAPKMSKTTFALEGVPIHEDSTTAVHNMTAAMVQHYANPKNADDLVNRIANTSVVAHLQDARLKLENGDDYRSAAVRAVQLINTAVENGTADPVSAIAAASAFLDARMAEVATQAYTIMKTAEAENRVFALEEMEVVRNYTTAVISKQALNVLRSSIVEDYSGVVKNNYEALGYSQDELAAMQHVYETIHGERTELDQILSEIGFHVLRAKLVHGMNTSASVNQYRAAVQLEHTGAYDETGKQLGLALATTGTVSQKVAAHPTRAALLEAAATEREEHGALVVYDDRREVVLSTAREQLVAQKGLAKTSTELVAYVTSRLPSQLGGITTEDANTLDMAIFADEQATEEQRIIAYAEAKDYRLLAQQHVQEAARTLNAVYANANVPEKAQTIAMDTLQRVLDDMNAESLVHQVLQEYLLRVLAYKQQARQARAQLSSFGMQRHGITA